MKNQTRFKSLDIVNNDERITLVYQDQDGIWVEVSRGWTADPRDAHDIHENRVKDILPRLKWIQPCECTNCRSN